MPRGGGLRRPGPMQHRGEACFVHVRAAPGAAAHLLEAIGELDFSALETEKV